MTRFAIVDAFTDQAFKGNPAAVVLDGDGRDDAWRQAVAAEFNLSETAFARPRGDGAYGLRWFTPKVEVALCGHATLACTRALRLWDLLEPGAEARFDTHSGELRCRETDGAIHMDFPAYHAGPATAPAGLLEALGLPHAVVRADGDQFLLEARSAAELRALKPDFAALADVACRGVCVTAAADAADEADFVSRYFAPRMGINEDPVTGSAHCRLAPLWAARLGKDRLRALQCSARGGRLELELRGDRVILGGRAVVVAEGTLRAS